MLHSRRIDYFRHRLSLHHLLVCLALNLKSYTVLIASFRVDHPELKYASSWSHLGMLGRSSEGSTGSEGSSGGTQLATQSTGNKAGLDVCVFICLFLAALYLALSKPEIARARRLKARRLLKVR